MAACSFDPRAKSACKSSPVIGFDFCPAHLATPRGLAHAQERIRNGPVFTVEDMENAIREQSLIPESDYHTSALEKMDKILTEVIEWTDEARANLYELDKDDWRFTDRNNVEQLRSEVLVYERAMDRAARTTKDVSKMALQEKIVSLGRAQTELIIRIMMAVIEELGLDAKQFDHARAVLLQKFKDEANLSSRLETEVQKELTAAPTIQGQAYVINEEDMQVNRATA